MKKYIWSLGGILGLAAMLSASCFAAVTGNAKNGQALFQNRCAACHSLDKNRVGPKLEGIVGQKAGKAEGYSYSPALAKSGLTWTAANLDKWLAGPQTLVPGQKMNFTVADPQDRADIIAWLKTQK